MRSNDPELAHNHPILLVTPVEMQFGKAQCCRLSELMQEDSSSFLVGSVIASSGRECYHKRECHHSNHLGFIFKQGVSGVCALVWGGSTASNHLEPPRTALL